MAHQHGKYTIQMLKEMFHIDEQFPIKKITLIAQHDDITTLKVEGYADLKDVDIKTTVLSKETTHNESKYEITIKKIGG